eukprot:3244584-Rhodomonas_salina.1
MFGTAYGMLLRPFRSPPSLCSYATCGTDLGYDPLRGPHVRSRSPSEQRSRSKCATCTRSVGCAPTQC